MDEWLRLQSGVHWYKCFTSGWKPGVRVNISTSPQGSRWTGFTITVLIKCHSMLITWISETAVNRSHTPWAVCVLCGMCVCVSRQNTFTVTTERAASCIQKHIKSSTGQINQNAAVFIRDGRYIVPAIASADVCIFFFQTLASAYCGVNSPTSVQCYYVVRLWRLSST